MNLRPALIALVFACQPAIPARSVLECRIDALRPVVADVYDAADIAREAAAKRVDLPRVLETAGAAPARARAVAAAFKACDGPSPSADAGVK